jgi:hypothetical protein
MLVMRDSVNASLIPTDTPVVAGYGDGLYMWSSSDWARFPNSITLSIVVDPAHQGDVLDVETGDAAPSDVPGWCDRFNRPQRRCPTVYVNRSNWAACRAAVGNRRVDWWVSTLDGTQQVPGAVAVQYTDTGAYDESVILDPTWVAEGSEEMGVTAIAFEDKNGQQQLHVFWVDQQGALHHAWLDQYNPSNPNWNKETI